MPSVRSRIKQFESLGSEEDKSNEEPHKATKPAKKFLYPGHSTQLDQRQSPIDHVITPQATTAGRQSGEHHNGMSNRLEEVWSVRRNIGVGRNVNSTISQLTTNVYSRHGALPAAGHLPPVVNKKDTGEISSFGRSRSPLQDHNHDSGRLRNIRAGGYSYSEAKKSHDLPPNMDISSSANKHKSIGIAAMIRPSDNGLLLPPVNHKNDKKRRYAEKMANAHLKSAGMGEYAPLPKRQSSGSHGDSEAGPSSRWKTRSTSEDDDFDF